MPSAVVEVAHLLLVLYHVCWFSSLFVFHGNIVLDSLKIFPVLEIKEEKCKEYTIVDIAQYA